MLQFHAMFNHSFVAHSHQDIRGAPTQDQGRYSTGNVQISAECELLLIVQCHAC